MNALRYEAEAQSVWQRNQADRLVNSQAWSVSSILHSYAVVDSQLSYEGHILFSTPGNPRYIPPGNRATAIDLLARGWSRQLGLTDKVRFLGEHGNAQVSPRLLSELRELATLRNWLVHGLVYETTLLVDDNSLAHDWEDSVDWSSRFPLLRFHSLDELNYQDARKALTVAIMLLAFVARVTKEPIPMSFMAGERYRVLVVDAATTANGLIEEFSRAHASESEGET